MLTISPVRQEDNFTGPGFIVRRLKRMQSNRYSMSDALHDSFSFQTPQPLSLPFEVNTTTSTSEIESFREETSVFQCCSSENIEVTNDNKLFDIINISNENKNRLNEQIVSFEDESYHSIVSKEEFLQTGTCLYEEEGVNLSEQSLSQVESHIETSLEDVTNVDLLESIEEALPEEFSLKRNLFCTHSVTMFRVLNRLKKVPSRLIRSYRSKENESENEVYRYFGRNKLSRLNVELMVQQNQLEQARKAMLYSTLTYKDQKEHLEAEKTLLLTSLRCDAVKREIDKLRRDQGSVERLEREPGVAIKEIIVPIENSSTWSSYHFMVVAVQGENVRGSEIRSCSEDCKLRFTTRLEFFYLKPDFTISIYLYGITIKEAKSSFFQKQAGKFAKSYKLKKRHSIYFEQDHSFTLIGSSEVRLDNIKHGEVTLHSNLETWDDSLTLKLIGKIYHDDYTGFLDIRHVQIGEDEKCSMWSRMWCKLSGSDLEGWAYPPHYYPHSLKEPEYRISIRDCTTIAEPVSAFLCVRPHTLVFHLEDHRGACYRVLCAADSADEMNNWCHHLNETIKAVVVESRPKCGRETKQRSVFV